MSDREVVAHPKESGGAAAGEVRGVRPAGTARDSLRGVSGLRASGVPAVHGSPNVPAFARPDPAGLRLGGELQDPISAAEAIAAFLEETDLRGCTPETRSTRARVIREFASYQTPNMVGWGQTAADHWFRDRRKVLAPRTLQKEVHIVRGFFLFLGERGLAPPWPIRLRIPRVKDDGVARYAHVSAEELEAICAKLEARRPLYVPMVRALWLTGLRIGELEASKPEHVDGGALWVPPAKTCRGRLVPLEPGALDALQTYWAGRRTTQQALRQALALVTKASPHDFRHSRAKEWLRAGAALHEVTAWLGHSSVLMTQRYLDVRATRPA